MRNWSFDQKKGQGARLIIGLKGKTDEKPEYRFAIDKRKQERELQRG